MRTIILRFIVKCISTNSLNFLSLPRCSSTMVQAVTVTVFSATVSVTVWVAPESVSVIVMVVAFGSTGIIVIPPGFEGVVDGNGSAALEDPIVPM